MNKSKKSEVITFRTDKNSKDKLDKIANKKKWTISQLVEVMVDNNINAIPLSKAEMEIQDTDRIPITCYISKSNEETIIQISEMLNIDFDEAINLVISHISIEWPFYKF